MEPPKYGGILDISVKGFTLNYMTNNVCYLAAAAAAVWTLFALLYAILYLFLCTTCLDFFFFGREILRVRAM